ncbi:MAG: methyltransferase [Saprospiraceae bacterium]|nr:methyltransferase [Saprospiraceae bacterium]
MQSVFKFKQFDLLQNDTVMKVGTDGLLLGAWVAVDNKTNILDIGTGSGVLPLMMAQRNQNATISWD